MHKQTQEKKITINLTPTQSTTTTTKRTSRNENSNFKHNERNPVNKQNESLQSIAKVQIVSTLHENSSMADEFEPVLQSIYHRPQ